MPAGRRPEESGFSLVEVLVAVAILSVLAGAVVLSLQPPPPAARQEADRLAARMALASEEALLGGAPIGLSADEDLRGYAFLSWRDGAWRPMTEHPALEPHRLAEDVFVEMRSEDDLAPEPSAPRREFRLREDAEDAPVLPQALFDPAGLDAPLSVEIAGPDRLYLIRRGEDGAVSIEAPAEAGRR